MNAGSVASLAVKQKAPREDEQVAADAISAVVDLAAPPEFEPNGRDTAPDWRMWMTDGRIVDVEVISSTNQAAREFTAALPDGSATQCREDERLAHRWGIAVRYHNPSGKDRTLDKLLSAVCDVLASVESQDLPPAQMMEAAQLALRIDPDVIGLRGRDRHVQVTRPPEHVGVGLGVVCVVGYAGFGGRVGLRRLIPPIQECISKKAAVARRTGANGPTWLAVVLHDEPYALFNDFFGPNAQSPLPQLDSIAFHDFDEVWIITELSVSRRLAVLRLSEGGNKQRRHIVPRLSGAA